MLGFDAIWYARWALCWAICILLSVFLISICNLLNSGFGTDLWPATNCDVRSFSKTTFEAESKSSGIIIIKLELFDNKFLNEALSKSEILEKSKLSVSLVLIDGKSALFTKSLSK